MKDKLLSILKERKDKEGLPAVRQGFTLIELLVVIAIIAILVVIVVVAINPVQRLNDATDRTAESNVRSTGTLIGVCITKALSAGGGLGDCDNNTEVASLGDGNVPTDVTVIGNGGTPTVICASQPLSGSSRFALYRSDTGTVTSPVSSASCS